LREKEQSLQRFESLIFIFIKIIFFKQKITYRMSIASFDLLSAFARKRAKLAKV
jgi:hypothetical protein